MGKFLSLLVVLLMLVSTATLAMGQGTAEAMPTKEDIKILLLDYSTCLSTGQVKTDSYYSSAMKELLQERRGFYAEFFDVGLHSDLISIESNFTVESIVRSNESRDVFHVQAVEMVTLVGKYRCSSPENYPLVKSGRWALARADDPVLRTAIENYINSMVDGVNRSIQQANGFETVLVVQHKLIVDSDGKSIKLVQDSFTDAASDNLGGYDNVSWVEDRSIRHMPDLTKMPDYVMYHIPVEDLGRSLLDTYLEMRNAQQTPLSSSVQYTYNRSAAVSYINTWVKTTSQTCAPDVLQNQNNWNPAYHKNWCNDCANYVSQALKAGGHTTTDTWYASPGSSAWNYVPSLKAFLGNTARGWPTTNYLNLQIGDLAFQGSAHAVMVSQVAPHKYSAHTSDRKNATWYSGLDNFMLICSSPGICPQ